MTTMLAWRSLAAVRQHALRTTSSSSRSSSSVLCARPSLQLSAHTAGAAPRRGAALVVRWSSSKTSPQQPLGLKSGGGDLSISPTMKVIGAYITVSMVAMITIAKYKDRDTVEEEHARVYNMAKRAVVKDRRFFEAIGYPKDFEPIQSPEASSVAAADSIETPSERTHGAFRVTGDKGSAIVTYKQAAQNADGTDESASDIVTFDVLHVQLADGGTFSALDSFLTNESVTSQQQSQSLGKKLFFPVIGGVVLGGISSFFMIRILRNRPSYVHKLVLDHVNNHAAARALLGHPIQSNRKEYVGSLTQHGANYSIACRGPKGEGTLIVKAFKDEQDAAREDRDAGPVEIMTTPGTAWKFSTLVLAVKRNSSPRAKNSKTINLLANDNASGSNGSVATASAAVATPAKANVTSKQ